jgi:hypothetical protein
MMIPIEGPSVYALAIERRFAEICDKAVAGTVNLVGVRHTKCGELDPNTKGHRMPTLPAKPIPYGHFGRTKPNSLIKSGQGKRLSKSASRAWVGFYMPFSRSVIRGDRLALRQNGAKRVLGIHTHCTRRVGTGLPPGRSSPINHFFEIGFYSVINDTVAICR